jgi:hypothetical protein
MRDIISATALSASALAEAYPLVRLCSPETTLERWRDFAEGALRMPRCRSGITGIRNRSRAMLALYIWRLCDDLELQRCFDVSRVFIAGLPGRALADYVVDCMTSDARRRACNAISVRRLQYAGQRFLPIERDPFDAAGFVRRGDFLARVLPDAAAEAQLAGC